MCTSYRPPSLLNTDNKILAKLLARRLQPMMLMLVLLEQAGFIPQRSTSQNLRTLMAVRHRVDPDLPSVAVLLDAEKAFNSLEWSFVGQILVWMSLGRQFLRYVDLLYAGPTARVCLTNLVSSPFDIRRGTRQGCPLSPLIFALATEPLISLVCERHPDAGDRVSYYVLVCGRYHFLRQAPDG